MSASISQEDHPQPAPLGLSVRGVTVRYGAGSRQGAVDEPPAAVEGASFDVAEGEIVALTGPSGCGKSTLLRAIAGLEPLANGRVSWSGVDLAGVPPHKRGFGMMFQDGQLFAHMSVAKNVAYGLATRNMRREDRERRALELLALVGLADYGARAVTELSGGQRQRVALARSLAPEPRLLLLDEPLSALDRELRERLAGEVSELLRRTGTTAILVTHDRFEAETIADRILPMRGGRVGE